ncbi:hypothetical protein RIA_1221 [Riemerella anatipestifer RA-GD]|nr:hypothetical protein RIA_1221 [Riemerella anatipestifer RA-GD]
MGKIDAQQNEKEHQINEVVISSLGIKKEKKKQQTLYRLYLVRNLPRLKR